ncbi:2-oxoacid:ferredoxin oxidoreductase subunit beta [Candidatus Methylomirabilis sp.]|uniref:2-oxoacid:ferredoxin oxidoreductase subunit beta n=1 Tax=Candidatus Methylomirabilis sp. TaxID=2032687 RepID=UPI002A666B99|nr:2-oxoacid:ferredoxin oxidoreductase subunit beta [Candidatus Methylomirabilis sp.]
MTQCNLEQAPKLTRKDFISDQDVRWCPGCGDYAILAGIQRVMPELGIPREKIVFVSGIGCSSRFPYYMNTYGFHSIHGRAPAIATGIKLTRPDLMIWVITGDGDGLSIGGNHLIHTMRRNVDLKILLFNNRIYGLTKGQTSPTSVHGMKTKSTPFGALDRPFNPLSVAIGSAATFVARSIDIDSPHLQYVLRRAADHKGTAFVELYQNCNVFNDGTWESVTDKDVRSDRLLVLEHGKPLVFGKERKKGIRMRPDMSPEVVEIDGDTSGLLIHDETRTDEGYHFMLSRLSGPDFPQPVGVLRAVREPTYDELMTEQGRTVSQQQGKGNLEKLLHAGETWMVS